MMMRATRSLATAAVLACASVWCNTAAAQTPPAAQPPPAPAPAAPPADGPSIRLGTTIFADYTFQQSPKITDSDGNQVSLNSFNIVRAYINVTGKISKRVSFRVTPDIVKESGAGSSLNGSYTFRLKFAYAQLALDSWLPPNSWARLGMQPTPWLEYAIESYRYRWQGPTFEERELYLVYADTGASARVTLPNDYGDIHAGVYNGEGSFASEINDQKGFMIRGAFRPLPKSPVMKGFRVSGFVDRDAYVKDRDRARNIFAASFEHKYFNGGFDYLDAHDLKIGQTRKVDADGWTMFANPRSTIGWEGLFRYDHLDDDKAVDGRAKNRVIAGVAYWLKPVNGVVSALMFDYDCTTFKNYSPSQPTQRKFIVHLYVNY